MNNDSTIKSVGSSEYESENGKAWKLPDLSLETNRENNQFYNLKQTKLNSHSSHQLIRYHQFIENRARTIFLELLRRGNK